MTGWDRYTSPAMSAIWCLDGQYERWRAVELAVIEARAAVGELDRSVVTAAREAPAPSVAAVAAEERITGHDVMAFLRVWTRPMPPDVARRIHRGLTASDIVDTAASVALRQTSDLLLGALGRLVGVLRDHAIEHRDTIRTGRTHGRAAQVDTWGHRVADLALAAQRCRERLASAARDAGLAKVSGPVGTYAGLDPRVERLVATRLGLRPAEVASQVVLRDRLAAWMASLALASSVCEALALEVRHGQREEVSELFEPFAAGQAGSSSMPHKRNPVTAEKICGLSRVVRALAAPVTEGIALWHERDISHSSVERICVPLAAAVTEHQIAELTRVFAGLVVDAERMRRNLRSAGLTVVSARLLDLLTERGVAPEEAYRLLRDAAAAGPERYEAEVRDRAATVGCELPDLDLVADASREVLTSPGLARAFDLLDRVRPA